MTKSNERKIIWEKWVNPLTGVGQEDAIEESDESDFDRDDYLAREARDYYPNDTFPKRSLGQCIVGPMGIIPLGEHNDPAAVYDFWLAHFSFEITPEIEIITSSTPGVETWNTISRYRARIGFAKAFNRANVMEQIHKNLQCDVTNKKEMEITYQNIKNKDFEILKRQLSKKYSSWAIFVKKDGQYDLAVGQEEATVREAISKVSPESYVKLFTSWEK